jgi:hypothetical protein
MELAQPGAASAVHMLGMILNSLIVLVMVIKATRLEDAATPRRSAFVTPPASTER